jgi:lipid-A-disaccharide synthase
MLVNSYSCSEPALSPLTFSNSFVILLPFMKNTPPHIVIVVGEESGDIRAAALVKAIKSQLPGVRFSGIGGDRCLKEGVELVAHSSQLAVMGFVEVALHFFRIKRVFEQILSHIKTTRPKAVLLVDYPGFNLRLAREVKKLGIKVIYYVSPQVWAWKASRVHLIKKVVDRMIVLFPFEKDFYAKYNYDATFAGHPLVGEVRADTGASQCLQRLGLNEKRRVVGLLPGSREKEIAYHLPILLKAAAVIKKERPETQFILLKARNLPSTIFNRQLKDSPCPVTLTEDYYNGLNACDVCVVCSGTATLEAALLEKPMVVIYRSSWGTWLIFKALIRIPYVSLVNIVAGKKLVDELLQINATPTKIATAILALLKDPAKLQTAARELRVIRVKLGSTGASQRAAKAVIAELTR